MYIYIYIYISQSTSPSFYFFPNVTVFFPALAMVSSYLHQFFCEQLSQSNSFFLSLPFSLSLSFLFFSIPLFWFLAHSLNFLTHSSTPKHTLSHAQFLQSFLFSTMTRIYHCNCFLANLLFVTLPFLCHRSHLNCNEYNRGIFSHNCLSLWTAIVAQQWCPRLGLTSRISHRISSFFHFEFCDRTSHTYSLPFKRIIFYDQMSHYKQNKFQKEAMKWPLLKNSLTFTERYLSLFLSFNI